MTQTWKIPALGDGVSEGVVAQLLAEVGQSVAAGDTLLEIETDKVVMEVPAPADGVIEAWLVAVGDTLMESTAFVRVTDSAASGSADEPAAAQAGEASADALVRDDSTAASGAVDADAAEDLQAEPAASAAPAEASVPTAAPPANGFGAADECSVAPAGPAARRLARELGVVLANVEGSGSRGHNYFEYYFLRFKYKSISLSFMSLEKKIEKGYFTFAMMKPDGMANGKAYYDFIGEIENQGLKIIYEEDILLNDDLLSKQYSHYADKPYYQVIIDYIKGVGDVITHIQEKEPKYKHEGNTAFIIYGENAIEKIRKILGEKDPEKADIQTIREKYGYSDFAVLDVDDYRHIHSKECVGK